MAANWFIGVPFPAGDWFAQLPAPPHGLRAFHAEDLHVTVAFLGPVDEARARAAFALADQFPRGTLEVALGPVVPMGPPRRYSALSIELDHGPLRAALGQVRDAMCDAAGAPRDGRSPRPHVTLARPTRKASPDERRAGLAWARDLALPSVHVRLDHLALYTWAASRTERLFRIVERETFATLHLSSADGDTRSRGAHT